MAAPALQKTWQGGSTAGGTQFVNVTVPTIGPRAALLAMHQAMTGFFSNPWTVIGSSDGTSSSMAGTNYLTAATDWIPYSGASARSWLLLQQTGIGATFQILIAIPVTDPNYGDLDIWCNEGGFGAANGGVDGTTTAFPTAGDPTKTFSIDGTGWLGDEGGSASQMVLTCISSTDGECTRVIASKESTGTPVLGLGIEKPRLPTPEWTVPAVAYAFKATVASGLSCFRWETMADSVANGEMHGNIPNLDSTANREILLMPRMPMFDTTEVIDLQEDDRPNPMLYPCELSGADVVNKDTIHNFGSLFDWYWCSRNPAGKHLLDLDTIPAAAVSTLSAFFDADSGGLPISGLEISDGAQTGLRATTALTLEFWVNLTAPVATQSFLIDAKGAGGFGYELQIVGPSGQSIRLDVKTAGGATQQTDRTPGGGSGVWRHIAVTVDSSIGQHVIYQNGVQVGSVQNFAADNIGVDGSPEPIVLGNDKVSSSRDFFGYMAEVRIWDIVRTPAEILANYNTELVGNEAGLQAYWKFGVDFTDATANSNDLTAVAGSVAPAPTLVSAVGRPFVGGSPEERTFVCMGDCVYGWLNDSATDLSYT